MSSVNIGNDHMHWVYVYNRNNIWCAMMLSLENRIGNHRVKSLLNLWIGLQMHLINPLNLITRGRYRHCMILRVKRFCARPTLCITTRMNDMKMSCELRTMFLIMEWYRTCCFHTWLHPMLHSQVCGNSSRNR